MRKFLSDQLSTYNYVFKEKKDKTVISLKFGLYGEVHFLEENRYKIKGVFRGWNFLTGLLPVNIEYLMLYNTIWLLILVGIQLYFSTYTIAYPYLPFIVILWVVSWNLYYTVKYFLFKAMVIRWIDIKNSGNYLL